MTNVCIIGYKPKDPYSFTNQQVLKRALEKKNCNISYIDFSNADVAEDGSILSENSKVEAFDLGLFATPIFTIPEVPNFERQNNILNKLKSYSNTIFVNSIDPHINTCNKSYMYEVLKEYDLPFPNTFNLANNVTDEELEEKILELNGYPVVMKHPLSSMGREVYLCNNLQELRAQEQELRLKRLGNIPIVIQEYFKYSEGLSINVRVIGDRVIPRITLGTPYAEPFKSNFAEGRGFIACKPIPELEELSIKATRALGLDTARLDIFIGEQGFSICEVNSIGSLIDAEQAWLSNIGEDFVDYCLQKVNE